MGAPFRVTCRGHGRSSGRWEHLKGMGDRDTGRGGCGQPLEDTGTPFGRTMLPGTVPRRRLGGPWCHLRLSAGGCCEVSPGHELSPTPGTRALVPPVSPRGLESHQRGSPLSSAPTDIAYLRSVLPSTTEEAFFDYLATLDTSEVTVSAVPEGSVVFARVGHCLLPFPALEEVQGHQL